MAQQMVNGSHHDGSVTMTNRMTPRYAVVGAPYAGKHFKTDLKSRGRQESWKSRLKISKRASAKADSNHHIAESFINRRGVTGINRNGFIGSAG